MLIGVVVALTIALLYVAQAQGPHHAIHDELREMHEMEIKLRRENKPKEAMQIREQIRSKLHLLPRDRDQEEEDRVRQAEEARMHRPRRRREKRPPREDGSDQEVDEPWLDKILEDHKGGPKEKFRRSSRRYIEKVKDHTSSLRSQLALNKDQFTAYEMSLIENDIEQYIKQEKELFEMRTKVRERGSEREDRDSVEEPNLGIQNGSPEDRVEREEGEIPDDDAQHKRAYMENIRRGRPGRGGVDHELWMKKRQVNDMYEAIIRRIQDPSPEFR